LLADHQADGHGPQVENRWFTPTEFLYSVCSLCLGSITAYTNRLIIYYCHYYKITRYSLLIPTMCKFVNNKPIIKTELEPLEILNWQVLIAN